MAVEQHKVEEFLYSNLSKVKRNGDGYVANCPICGDSIKRNKRRLHVDYYDKYDEWVYKCYNGGCDESGNIMSLYAYVMGCTYIEADNLLNDKKYDSKKLKDKLNGTTGTRYVDDADDINTNTLLDLDLNFCYQVTDKPDDKVGKQYVKALRTFVKDRRIPYKKYKPMVCFGGKYNNRFIIPVFDGEELVYFQARKMFDFMEPKFLNPDVVKEKIILNRRVFDPEKYIIVTEGLLCAMSIGDQGTSCLGATVSDEFLSKLMPLTNKGIILALDNPLIDEAGYKNYIKILENSKYAKKLRYFFMPDDKHKDINDIAMDNEVSYLPKIYDFIIKHSYSHFKSNHLVKSV